MDCPVNSYSLPKGREYVIGSVWLSACYPSRLHSFQDVIFKLCDDRYQ